MQVYDYMFYAGLMFVDILIFAIMARFYKYKEVEREEDIIEDLQLSDNIGAFSPSFVDSDKHHWRGNWRDNCTAFISKEDRQLDCHWWVLILFVNTISIIEVTNRKERQLCDNFDSCYRVYGLFICLALTWIISLVFIKSVCAELFFANAFWFVCVCIFCHIVFFLWKETLQILNIFIKIYIWIQNEFNYFVKFFLFNFMLIKNCMYSDSTISTELYQLLTSLKNRVV